MLTPLDGTLTLYGRHNFSLETPYVLWSSVLYSLLPLTHLRFPTSTSTVLRFFFPTDGATVEQETT